MSPKDKNAAINRILKEAKKCEMPSNLTPMNFKLHPAAFNDEEWIFEIKWDGFGTVAYCSNGVLKLPTRNNNSFDKRFHAAAAKPIDQ